MIANLSFKLKSVLMKGFNKPHNNVKLLHRLQMSTENYNENHIFSVAPMMDYTDRHQRKLQRMITKKAVLYTEMITANALTRSDDYIRFLESDFSIEEPLVIQLGGSDRTMIKSAAKIASGFGYKEINLNIGCPSEKVAGKGQFGAALMFDPNLVAELSLAISEETGKPATIKCRIGVDDKDTYEDLIQFIDIVSRKGSVNHFIIHARKAELGFLLLFFLITIFFLYQKFFMIY
jgi:tRNA-dihydrouridine synthase A